MTWTRPNKHEDEPKTTRVVNARGEYRHMNRPDYLQKLKVPEGYEKKIDSAVSKPNFASWKALAEIYTMHSFAPFSMLKIFFKNR